MGTLTGLAWNASLQRLVEPAEKPAASMARLVVDRRAAPSHAVPQSSPQSSPPSQPTPPQPRALPRKTVAGTRADQPPPQEPPPLRPDVADFKPGDRVDAHSGGDSRQQGQDGDDAQAGDSPADDVTGSALQEAADWMTSASLAALLPSSPGVFEVVLPDGGTLGVAVDATPDRVSYLLTPGSPALADALRAREMELGRQLERRMGRSVRLTVL